MSGIIHDPVGSEIIDSRLDHDYDELLMTVRFKVPGGWLYRSSIAVARSVAICQTFVKDET